MADKTFWNQICLLRHLRLGGYLLISEFQLQLAAAGGWNENRLEFAEQFEVEPAGGELSGVQNELFQLNGQYVFDQWVPSKVYELVQTGQTLKCLVEVWSFVRRQNAFEHGSRILNCCS